jgi:hypothetical protein
MSPEVIFLIFLAVTVPMGVALVWGVRRLLYKHDNWKGLTFAPTTIKDHPYGYGSAILVFLMMVVVMGMRAFDLEHAWIRQTSEITPYNGSYAELLVPAFVIAALVAARYFSILRVLFFAFALLFLVLLFLLGRDSVNVQWDTSPPAQFLGTIINKKVVAGSRKSGAPDDHYLHATSSGDKQTIEIPVPAETYRAAAVGDEISLEVHGGYFNRRWANAKVAVLRKAQR